MRVGSKPSTPTALRGASSLQVLEGLLQKSALNGRKAPEVEESGEILAKNISSNCLSKNLAHSPVAPGAPVPCQVPTCLKELGAPGAEAVISRPLDVPVLAWSCPTALTAHAG